MDLQKQRAITQPYPHRQACGIHLAVEAKLKSAPLCCLLQPVHPLRRGHLVDIEQSLCHVPGHVSGRCHEDLGQLFAIHRPRFCGRRQREAPPCQKRRVGRQKLNQKSVADTS